MRPPFDDCCCPCAWGSELRNEGSEMCQAGGGRSRSVWKDETVRGWKKWRRAGRSKQRRGSSLKCAFFSCPGTGTWCLGRRIAAFWTWAVRCVGSPHAKHLPAGHHPAGCHGTAVLCFLNSDRSCTVDLKTPAQFRSFLRCQDTVTVMEV